MKPWSPEHFEIGARVVNAEHPEWGEGEVLDARRVGELRILNGPVYQLSSRSPGQRLSVLFADGRTRTIITATTPLKSSSN